jgi:hypothetical protein
VVVAELVPGVVEWNRGPLGEKSGRPLLDPRTVSAWKTWPRCCKPSPRALTRSCSTSTTAPKASAKANSWLYSAGGLAPAPSPAAQGRAGGGRPAPTGSSATSRKAGFKAEEVQVFAHGNRTRSTIWIAEKLKG